MAFFKRAAWCACALVLACSEPGLRPAPPQVESGRARIVFGGDFSFGENYLEEIAADGGENVLETRGYDYCLEKLDPLLSGAELVIANLETPITDLSASPLEGRKYYIHWSDPVLAPPAMRRHNIRAVTLANNHGMDFGADGLAQTFAALDGAGIAWFGAGRNEAEAARPFVYDTTVGGKRVRIVVVGGFEHAPHYARAWDFYARGDTAGVNDWTAHSAAAQIRAARKEFPDAFIVAFPHWGHNFRWKNRLQLEAARAVIDAGADLAIGHSGHMMQEIDRYHGRWIVYGIGNLLFNSPGLYDDYGIHSYSSVAALDVTDAAGVVDMRLRLYPITSDNDRIRFQPGPVSEQGFDDLQELLLHRGPIPRVLREGMTRGHDDFGFYFELDVTPQRNRKVGA